MKTGPLAAALLLLLLAPAPPVGADGTDAAAIGDLQGDERILHVLNRLGYGPRPGDVERVREQGVYPWIVAQLHPEGIADEALAARLAHLADFRRTATELAQQYGSVSKEEREMYAADLARLAALRAEKDPPKEEVADLQKRVREYRTKTDRNRPLLELASARVIRAVHSERQLEEVMVDFWFNHFNVFGRKGQISLLIPEFEEQVIRPNALGNFRDLLVAVAKSPAMLYYLDNFQSIAPPGAPVIGENGKTTRRPARAGDRGLNENWARELLELHTLGVDHGYDQRDVIEVARCFTGWSITGPAGRGKDRVVAFEFRPAVHDAGEKVVTGRTIPAGRGIEDGMDVLEFLASHPNTARFLSGKLCRKFVSDDPPASLVDRCTRTFLESGGDIRLTLLRIFTSPEFFAAEAARAKLKTPFEFAMSAIRAVGGETDAPVALLYAIGRLGEPLYLCEPPTGYPDEAERWGGSNSVLARVNFGAALAFGRVPGVKIDAAARLKGAPVDDRDALVTFVIRSLLGRPLSTESRAALDETVTRAREAAGTGARRATPRETVSLLAALVFGSPDFQMQ